MVINDRNANMYNYLIIQPAHNNNKTKIPDLKKNSIDLHTNCNFLDFIALCLFTIYHLLQSVGIQKAHKSHTFFWEKSSVFFLTLQQQFLCI